MLRSSYLLATALGLCACSSAPTVQNSSFIGPQQDTEQCAGAASMCLYGTAKAVGYASSPNRMQASLYRVFPSILGGGTSTPTPVAQQIVARDGTWAFSTKTGGAPLDAWAHYYVQIVPEFNLAQVTAVATRVGPLALPSTSPASVDIKVQPVQLEVLEQAASGQPMSLESATAHLFDDNTGNEIQPNGKVSILVGGNPVALPWSSIGGGQSAYYHQFSNPLPVAQPTYQIATAPDATSSSTTWNLSADVPTFTADVTTPTGMTPVPVGKDLQVSWPLQGQADYEIVQLFRQTNLTQTYVSPQLDPPDTNVETIPGSALSTPGMYVLNVDFLKANCPATADGCVQASLVKFVLLTVQ